MRRRIVEIFVYSRGFIIDTDETERKIDRSTQTNPSGYNTQNSESPEKDGSPENESPDNVDSPKRKEEELREEYERETNPDSYSEGYISRSEESTFSEKRRKHDN